MKSTITPIKYLLFVASLTFMGCFPSEDENPPEEVQGELIQGVAVIPTEDNRVPFIFAHEDGGEAAMVDTDENGLYDRLAFQEDDTQIVLELDETNGMPTKLYHSDGLVILYSFKENNSLVDIALLKDDDEVGYLRDVDTSFLSLDNAISKTLPYSFYKNQQTDVLEALQNTVGAMSLAWNAGVCIFNISATFASAGVTSPVTLPTALISCGGFLTDFVLFVANNTGLENQLGNQLNGVRSLLGLLQDYQGCTRQADISSCLAIGLSAIDGILNIAELVREAVGADSIDLAEGALISGFGQVKVTLTWDTGADIDLWVTEPNGNLIYWNNPNSFTGGQLDFDDLDGPGPENIFWTENAPAGNYLVQVQKYSPNGFESTNYTVQTELNGAVEIYRGVLTQEGQINDVAQFTIGTTNKVSSTTLEGKTYERIMKSKN